MTEQFGVSVKPYLFTLEDGLRTQKGETNAMYQRRAAQQSIEIVDRKILQNTTMLNNFLNTFK